MGPHDGADVWVHDAWIADGRAAAPAAEGVHRQEQRGAEAGDAADGAHPTVCHAELVVLWHGGQSLVHPTISNLTIIDQDLTDL